MASTCCMWTHSQFFPVSSKVILKLNLEGSYLRGMKLSHRISVTNSTLLKCNYRGRSEPGLLGRRASPALILWMWLLLYYQTMRKWAWVGNNSVHTYIHIENRNVIVLWWVQNLFRSDGWWRAILRRSLHVIRHVAFLHCSVCKPL